MSGRTTVDNVSVLARSVGVIPPWARWRVDVIEPSHATRAWYDVDLSRDDRALERWGRLYCANNFYARGVLFETFMVDPRAIAEAILFRKAMPIPAGQEFYPLLPEQTQAATNAEGQTQARTTRRVPGISKPIGDVFEARRREIDNLPVFLRKQSD